MSVGYAGRVLHVDLSVAEHAVEDLPIEQAHRLLGGFGMNNALAFRYLPPRVDPLSESNVLILGAGPLVGTMVPGAVRLMATTKQPLNGAVAAAAGSLGLGSELRWAGYDHVVISGRTPRPVVLSILDDEIDLEDASDLWGLGINQTTEILRRRHPGAGVLAIGPAGERQISFAIALVDRSATVGRGGLGAVMGSKGLKAIVAKGTGGSAVADRRAFVELLGRLHERLRAFPGRSAILDLGMMVGWDSSVQVLFPNSPVTPEMLTRTFGPKVYRGLKARRAACPSCFVPCKDVLRIPGEAKEMTPTSFLNVALMGYRFGMDATEAAMLLDKLNDLGLDLMTFGAMADWAIQASEKKILGGKPVVRAAASVQHLLEELMSARGLGGVMAGGWKALEDEFGPDALSPVPLVRHMDALYDPRFSGLGTMEFEQVVCPRGPTSATAGSPTYLPGVTPDKMARHLDRMGVPPSAAERILAHPLGLDVGRLSVYAEHWYSALSSLGICMRAQNNRFYSAELCAALYEAATGLEMDRERLMLAAERGWNLMRLLNARETKANQDTIPPQWFEPVRAMGTELVMQDYYRRCVLTQEDLTRFLAGYYEERGWEPSTGLPSEATSSRLGLQELIGAFPPGHRRTCG
jgi:aldehyde:ferredoxin oxidoreductase